MLWKSSTDLHQALQNGEMHENCNIKPPVSTAVLASLTGHWLCVCVCLCVCKWVCVCLVRFSLCGTALSPAPIRLLGPETESAHYSKRRSHTSENAESIILQRSVWHTGRCKGSSGWVFSFMTTLVAKEAGDRQKETKGESQKEMDKDRKGGRKVCIKICFTLEDKKTKKNPTCNVEFKQPLWSLLWLIEDSRQQKQVCGWVCFMCAVVVRG